MTMVTLITAWTQTFHAGQKQQLNTLEIRTRSVFSILNFTVRTWLELKVDYSEV